MNYKDKLNIYNFINLTPTDICNWLERNATNGDSESWRNVAEYILFRRNNDLINISLARYGVNINVLKKLYQSDNKFIKLATLTNSRIGPENEGISFDDFILDFDDLINILKNYHNPDDFLEALFSNPHINRDVLSDLLNRKERFKFIDDDLLLIIMKHLSTSTIFSQEYDRIFLDGYDEYRFNLILHDFWKVCNSAPITPQWADALTKIIEKINIPHISDNITEDTINRWNIDGGGGKYHVDYIRRAIAKRYFENAHGERKDFVNPKHPDKSIRLAYFESCKAQDMFGYDINKEDFYYPSFENEDEDIERYTDLQKDILNKCKEYFEIDKNDFIESLIYNENFWMKENERDFLNSLAWKLADDPGSWMEMPNLYRGREQYYIENFPKYFVNDDAL